MKKLILIITLAMVFAFSNMAMAEGPQVTVGLKTWASTWEIKSGGMTLDSDYGLMYGPSANVRYGNAYVGLNYLLGTFSFEEEGDKLDADRTDLDLFAGYYFHPNISALVGYKVSDFDKKLKYSDGSPDDTWTEKLSGPVLGVNGHYQIGSTRWVLFGNLSFVFLDDEYKASGPTINYTAFGPAIEFGGAYAMEMVPLSISIGIKSQNYTYDYKDKDDEDIYGKLDYEDTFSGITFGVNYIIQ